MIGLLGLPNVAAVQCRAEDYAPGHTFDTVLARALAGIPRIIEVGAHLAGEKGVLLALKGRYPADELEQLQLPGARWTWQVDKVDVPGLEQHARHIVTLKRNNL
jgi:16S rRNA (guanine527-N7)-methyltransferase